ARARSECVELGVARPRLRSRRLLPTGDAPIRRMRSCITSGALLPWSGADPGHVYACGKPTNGFFIGVSADMGETFQPLLHLPCLRGPLACAADTAVGTLCTMAWPAIANQIGKTAGGCSMDGASGGRLQANVVHEDGEHSLGGIGALAALFAVASLRRRT